MMHAIPGNTKEEAMDYLVRKRKMYVDLVDSAGNYLNHLTPTIHRVNDFVEAFKAYLCFDLDLTLESMRKEPEYTVEMLIDAQQSVEKAKEKLSKLEAVIDTLPVEQRELAKLTAMDQIQAQLTHAEEWLKEVQDGIDGVKE